MSLPLARFSRDARKFGGDKRGRRSLLDRNWITKHQKVVKKFNKSRSRRRLSFYDFQGH